MENSAAVNQKHLGASLDRKAHKWSGVMVLAVASAVVVRTPVGTIAGLEILAITVGVTTALKSGVGRRNILVLAAVYGFFVSLAAAELTNSLAGTSPLYWSVTAEFVLFASSVAGVVIYHYRPSENTRAFWLATSVGLLAAVTFFPVPGVERFPWALGYGFPVTVFALAVFDSQAPGVNITRTRTVIAVSALSVLSLVNLRFGLRSAGLICLVAALVKLVLAVKQRTSTTCGSRAAVLLGGAVAIAVATYVLIQANLAGISGRYYQTEIAAKLQEAGLHGVAQGSRPATFEALQLAAERPLVGHGSAAIYARSGHAIGPDMWLAAGWGGLFLWGVLTALIVRHLILSTAHGNPSAVDLFVCGMALWNLLFSPLSGIAKVAVLLAVWISGTSRRYDLTSTRTNRFGDQ